MSQDLSQSSWEDPARHETVPPRKPTYEQLEQELLEARAQSSRLILEMEILRETYERLRFQPDQIKVSSQMLLKDVPPQMILTFRQVNAISQLMGFARAQAGVDNVSVP